MSKSLYDVIGVNPNADRALIEAKCLELGRHYHPDSNPNNLDAALKYKEVMLAYSTLTDLNKRLAYDASLKNKTNYKKVSFVFVLAIIFVPWVAVWFLLKEGYSKKARIISFTWLALFAIVYFKPKPASLTPEELAQRREVPYDAQRELHEGIARQKKQSEDFAKNQKTRENRIMGTWKSAVQELLVDPDSADFKKVVFVTDVSGTPYSCGEVNSKNRMGGYTGYKGFITAGDKNYTLIEGETKGFSKYWHDICVNGRQM